MPRRTDLRVAVTAPRGEGLLECVLHSRRGIRLAETEPLYVSALCRAGLSLRCSQAVLRVLTASEI